MQPSNRFSFLLDEDEETRKTNEKLLAILDINCYANLVDKFIKLLRLDMAVGLDQATLETHVRFIIAHDTPHSSLAPRALNDAVAIIKEGKYASYSIKIRKENN